MQALNLKRHGFTFYSYILIHVLGLAALFFIPFHWSYVALFAINYFWGMFFITAGYHRYFSHRSYKIGRVTQFILAFICETSGEKGILWWAANHRDHHIYSDTDQDVHSPIKRGFWYSHMGWIFDEKTQGYNPKKVADFGKYPELRFLDKYHWIPPMTYALTMITIGAIVGGPMGAFAWFIWGFVLVLICQYQASYCVNSLAHVYGTRRFDTDDFSRNNWFLAIITLGEGWHNNHHYYKASCRQGYKWWEIDITFYLLTLFSWIGIVKDIRPFRIDNKGVTVEAKQPEMTAV